MSTRRLFISTVTHEFLSCRQRLAEDLRFPGVVVETQENIAKLAAGHSILLKLDDYLAHCDAVIHLLGRQTAKDGRAASQDAVDDLLRRYPDLPRVVDLTEAELRTLSYTQWEAWLTYYHFKTKRPQIKLLLATPTEKFVPDNPPDPATARDQDLSQAWHEKQLKQRARYPEIEFAEAKDLSIQILRALKDLLPAREPEQHIAPSRLVSRHTAADFLGREKELALLDSAWAGPRKVNVLGIIAWGGVGKTALLARWVQSRFAENGWKNAEGHPDPLRYFDWTFYDQGTRSDDATRPGTASVDLFFEAALTFFGDDAPHRPGKGARLARLVQAHRSLLVLDGLEPLQYPLNHPQAGQILDPDLHDLLCTLAQRNPGLCLVSSRQTLGDLRGSVQTTAPQHDLEDLPEDVAVRLLRQLQIAGSDEDLRQAARDYAGHALSLILLGRYLFVAKGGDIRKRDTLRLERANDQRDAQTRNAWHVLEAYEQWLATPQGRPEDRQALRLAGLFDRPASPDCLAALRAAPAIPGLTDLLVPLDPDTWNVLLRRLHDAHLFQLRFPAPGQHPHAPRPEPREVPVDVHPLIREYFAKQLRDQQPESFRAAHSRLFDHLCATTPHRPDTLPGLQPLYQAVTHGCLAERQREALEKVYRDRILRGTGADGFYSSKRLGAIGENLGAVAAFFDQPWTRLSPNLSAPDQAWLLNEAAFYLRARGRLTEAVEPMRTSLQMAVESNHWKPAAIRASNLSELEVTLGQLTDAVADAHRAIELADRSGDAFQKMGNRTTAADALHQAGERAEAMALFAEAERMQAERQPQFPLLYSLPGFRYADLFLAPAETAAWRAHLECGGLTPLSPRAPEDAPETVTRYESAAAAAHSKAPRPAAAAPLPPLAACDEAERRAAYGLPIAQRNNWLLDTALDHLTQVRAALYRAHLTPDSTPPPPPLPPAAVADALARLRAANQLTLLPQALLTAAFYQGALGNDPAEAARLLDEAQQIAERGPMPLHLADVHLHRARLAAILPADTRNRHFPDLDPKAELARARTLIEEHGYWRRREELADAEAAAASWK